MKKERCLLPAENLWVDFAVLSGEERRLFTFYYKQMKAACCCDLARRVERSLDS